MFTTQTFLPLLTPFLYVLGLIAGLTALRMIFWFVQYRNSSYGQVSGNNYWQSTLNTGNFGEFLTFRKLEKLQGNHKILTNIYVPKSDGSTTELDLVLINQTGIYVFESKNYSGWIFGDEKNKNWTQSLKGGKKIKFLNPIWQNKGHISALSNLVKDIGSQYIYSYIVFSERCELKKVSVAAQDVKVVKRDQLLPVLRKDIESRSQVISEDLVSSIFDHLQKLSKVDDETKAKHIQMIQNKLEKE